MDDGMDGGMDGGALRELDHLKDPDAEHLTAATTTAPFSPSPFRSSTGRNVADRDRRRGATVAGARGVPGSLVGVLRTRAYHRKPPCLCTLTMMI